MIISANGSRKKMCNAIITDSFYVLICDVWLIMKLLMRSESVCSDSVCSVDGDSVCVAVTL